MIVKVENVILVLFTELAEINTFEITFTFSKNANTKGVGVYAFYTSSKFLALHDLFHLFETYVIGV